MKCRHAAVSRCGGGAAAAPQENTESTIAIKLVQAGRQAAPRDDDQGQGRRGFSLQTGLGLAKFAGGMYLSMFAGPMMLATSTATAPPTWAA